jgi:hypothetical protein
MDYKAIEDLIAQDDGLEVLLKQYKESFDRIHYYQELFKNGAISTPNATDSAMKELLGIYMSLNGVITMIDTVKGKLEDVYYVNKKNEIESIGSKFVSSSIKEEVSMHVSLYRRVRNIFQFYRDNCDKAILVCQSSLKSMEREWKQK